jgi:hypothetical protein
MAFRDPSAFVRTHLAQFAMTVIGALSSFRRGVE